jgi:hypothetical protein
MRPNKFCLTSLALKRAFSEPDNLPDFAPQPSLAVKLQGLLPIS